MQSKYQNHKIITPSQLKSLLDALSDGEQLPLTVTGHSMLPFLHPGRDTVYLTRFDGKALKGDILMFSVGDRTILHRVKAVSSDGILFLGDAQTKCDGPIKPDFVIASCKSVLRKGKLLKINNIFWLFFSKIWINLVPFRKIIFRLYNIYYNTVKGRAK